MRSDTFAFHPTLILRTPVHHFNQEISKEAIKECLIQSDFREALYLASPTLYQQSQKWLAGQITGEAEVNKLLLSVAKYLNRSRSRCTPFGRFASSAVVHWQQSSKVLLGPETQRARLDMGFLRTLTQQLSEHPLIRKHLDYYPNSSWYTIGNEIRYVEHRSQAGHRTYQISSVAGSEELQPLLEECHAGLSYTALVDYLISQKIALTEAIQFADELIQAQLLVSELEPTVTGTDPLRQVLNVLQRVHQALADDTLDPLIKRLRAIEEDLIRAGQPDAGIPLYQRIREQAKPLLSQTGFPSPLSGTQLQVNTFQEVAAGTVDQRWQGRIKQAMEVLTYFSLPPENKRLARFQKQFYERYEEAEVPLLSVLDTETGIRYGEMGQEVSSSLVDGLISSQSDTSALDEQRSVAEQWLLQKIQRSESDGIVKINTKEIKFLANSDYVMPPSSSVLFRFIDHDTMHLEGVSGTSAANLLGRFANDDSAIYRMVQEVTEAEQKNNPDVILAEIAHLPGQKVGNILRRPTFRNYELPYLAQSTRPKDQQIALQDLWVSVHNERSGGQRVILRSRQLNKEVMPRLSTAHNYAFQSLPVYQFLCDLQSQGIHRSLGLNWHPSHYRVKQLPRLTYGRIILGLKTWYLQREDFQDLFTTSADSQKERMRQWVTQWNLPRYFVLVEGDRELLVDLQNSLTIQVWREAIRKQSAILLKEFLFDPKENVVTDKAGNPYVNQWIATVIKEDATYSSVPIRSAPTEYRQRSFSLGSEWLYYKLYSGTHSSDKILLEAIDPLTEALLGDGLINRWFFIRYADPDDHLRVRFRLNDIKQLGLVINWVNKYLQPFEESGHIWKIHTDTYRRETERYGASNIELSEQLFFHDSQRVLALLTQTQQDEGRSQRWLAGLVTLDRWLTWFGYNTEEKYRLVETIRHKFYQEFAVDKQGKRRIDARYRTYQDRMITKLQSEYVEDPSLCRLIAQIKQVRAPDVPLDRLAGSYAHMHINRLVSTHQRLHELMIYDFLARHYKSALARG